MSAIPGDRRFFASTRGRILALLRRSGRTVEELAQTLDLTYNAVRTHLATLERDGLVVAAGARRGLGKPATLYQLTPQAERLFPKAYTHLLSQVLDVLGEEMAPAVLDAFLLAVGRRLAAQEPRPAGSLGARVAAAGEVLNKLGGLTEIEESDGVYYLCGYSCPFSEVVETHPEVCRAVQAMLSAMLDQPVTERCPRSDSLCCWFEISQSAGQHSPT